MTVKDNSYSIKRKINLLFLPLALLIFILLLTAPAKAPDDEFQALGQEVSRLLADRDAFSARPSTFSDEEIRRLKERRVRLQARILEAGEIGLISLDAVSGLLGRMEFWILTELSESERAWPSLQGRYEAILSANRDAHRRYGGQRLLERLSLIFERYNLLKQKVRAAYYQGQISEAQRDELIDRIEQEHRLIERDITSLEAASGRKGSDEKPVSVGPSKAEELMDISGTWLEIKGGKPGREWEIRVDKTGKITLTMQSKNAPKKLIEYSGSIKGNIITARYIIKDPAVMNPKIPIKVRETVIKESAVVWTLDLKVSKSGTTIEGKHDDNEITWNKKTLKVKKIRPHLVKLILKKKVKCADILSQLYNAVRSFESALKRKDRPLMIKAKQRVEDLQLSLKSLKPLPQGCERLIKFIPKVLKDMNEYINPPKKPVGKGPPEEDMLGPDTAVISGETHPIDTPEGQINRLSGDLVRIWETSSGQEASEAVRNEAYDVAEAIIRCIHRKYDAGWRGGWGRNFIVGIRETAEEWGLDSLAGRLPHFGKCYEWSSALEETFTDLNRPHSLSYFRGAHIWQPGHPSSGIGTHHAFAIYRNGGSFEEGLVIDPWRNDGQPFWLPVGEDTYNWLRFPHRQ